MRGMKHLETLEIDYYSISSVPADIVDLPLLSHLILPWDVMLPDGIGRAKSLRTLNCFRVPKDSSEHSKGLGELTNLTELRLKGT